MGLNKQESKTSYLSIQGGKIAHRVPEATATSKSRVIESSGKLIHEEIYDSVTGHITGIDTRDGNYGKELQITLLDNGDRYVLQLKLSSRPAASFLKALPNIDLSQPVTLFPKIEQKDEIRLTNIICVQNKTGVKWAFTKDAPNGLPGLKLIKVKGKETWDDTDQLEFFERLISETAAKLKASGTVVIGAEDDKVPF